MTTTTASNANHTRRQAGRQAGRQTDIGRMCRTPERRSSSSSRETDRQTETERERDRERQRHRERCPNVLVSSCGMPRTVPAEEWSCPDEEHTRRRPGRQTGAWIVRQSATELRLWRGETRSVRSTSRRGFKSSVCPSSVWTVGLLATRRAMLVYIYIPQ